MVKLLRSISKSLLIAAALCPLCPLYGQQGPELSSDEPINFSAETGMLIAAGNAVFTEELTRVEADTIRFQRERGLIEAEGNVRVTRAGIRLVADWLSYDTRNRKFAARNFRAGYPPLFMEGAAFSGTFNELELEMVRLSYREPTALSPRLRAENVRYVADTLLEASEVRLQLFPGFSLPMPDLSTTGERQLVKFESTAGYSSELGVYANALALVPVTARLAAGGRFGVFSDRGVLIGPALAYNDGKLIRFEMESGWIRDHDRDGRGSDFVSRPISRDRGYINWALHSRSGDDRRQLVTSGTYVSDSELLRDFAAFSYEPYLHPDNFIDFSWQNGPWMLSTLARAQINDYYGMVERLPELRIEYLPTEISASGIWIQAFGVATRYRQQFLEPGVSILQTPPPALGLPQATLASGMLPAKLTNSDFFSRAELGFTLLRPIALPAGVDLSLRAGGRWSSFHHSATATRDLSSASRSVGELGADISQTLTRTFSWTSRMDREIRLRHISRTFASYRWHPGADDQPAIVPGFDRLPYSPIAPVINLSDLQHMDAIRDWSLLRFGWEHRLQRSVDRGTFRDWLLLTIQQDLRFDADPDEPDWDGLYIGADFRPFAWLRLQYLQKFLSDTGRTEASLLRTTVQSADLWAVSFSAEYLRAQIEQYELEGSYRITQDWGVVGRIRYDSLISSFTRQQYGIFFNIGNVWQIQTYVSFSNNDARFDDFAIGMQLRLLSF